MNGNRLMKASALALAGVTLAACSGGGDTGSSGGSEEGGSLTIWMDENRATALEGVIAQFEDETGVSVDVIVKEFDSIRDDLVTQAPGGDGPDIVLGAHDWIGKLVQNGVISSVELGDQAADFQDVSIEAMTYDGGVYGVPVSVENIALVRNTALAPEAPASFDDMIATGQAAVAAGSAQYPMLVGLDPSTSDPYHLYPLEASFGGPLFGMNDDGSYDPDDLQIGNEGNLQFAQKLAEWGTAGILNLSISGDIAKEQFAAGASPYMITGPWNLQAFQDAGIEYAIDPIPAAGPLPATPFVGVQGFFLSAYSENSIVATQFLTDYVASEDAQTAIFEGGQRAPALTAAYEAAQSNADVAAFGAVGAEGVPMPNIPEMDAVWADWGTTEVQIISGQGDPATLWSEMATKIETTISGG